MCLYADEVVFVLQDLVRSLALLNALLKLSGGLSEYIVNMENPTLWVLILLARQKGR